MFLLPSFRSRHLDAGLDERLLVQIVGGLVVQLGPEQAQVVAQIAEP